MLVSRRTRCSARRETACCVRLDFAVCRAWERVVVRALRDRIWEGSVEVLLEEGETEEDELGALAMV